MSSESDEERIQSAVSVESRDGEEPEANAERISEDFKEPKSLFKEPTLNDSKCSEDSMKSGSVRTLAEEASKNDIKTDAPVGNLKKAPSLTYQEPSWSGLCSQPYLMEVVKNGVSVCEFKLSSKAYWVVGRLAECDIPMEHPSLSRYHAILQYCAIPTDNRQVGWYLYDLNSTHGTVLNKQRVAPNEFHRLRVGYTFKFGGSSRLHILHGPDDDQDTELTPEDLAALRQKRKNQLEERLKLKPEQEGQTAGGQADADGCSWGIDDDAEDIDPDAVNPFASEEPAEELQLDDPKKALRGWFEREGYDEPEYVVEEKSHGVHVCTVDLPADTPTGQPMRAQVSVQGKKKEAVVQCALEACRLLDRHGLLRQAKHESRKRKAKNWGDNDFYDSDDDTFLDRTGDIEKKRKLRMRRAGKLEEEEREKALTYDQLVGQLMKLETEMKEIQEKLDRNKRMEKDRDADLDDLDAYMMSIKSGGMNATEKTKLKRRMIELKTDTLRLEKLIRIAKPNSLPEVRNKLTSSKTNAVDRSSEQKELQGKEPITSKEASARLAQVSSPNSQIELTHADELNMTPKLDTSVVVAPEAAKDNSIPNTDSPSICKMDISASDRTEASMSLKSQAELEKCLHVSKSDSNDADTPPTQKTQHAPVSESRSSTKPSRKVHVKKSQASVKKAREAPAGGGLAGMVSDLKSKAEEEEYANDPDHITWMPPKGQSGDGRTNLNDKYGY